MMGVQLKKVVLCAFVIAYAVLLTPTYGTTCNDNNCAACDDSEAGSCTTCNSGYFVENGTCTECVSCASGYVNTGTNCPGDGSVDTVVCEACNDANCAACDDSLAGSCTTCNSGYFLENGACTVCVTCANGYVNTGTDCAGNGNADTVVCEDFCTQIIVQSYDYGGYVYTYEYDPNTDERYCDKHQCYHTGDECIFDADTLSADHSICKGAGMVYAMNCETVGCGGYCHYNTP